MVIRFGAIAALALLAMPALAQDYQQKPRSNSARNMMLELGAGMKGEELAAAVKKAEQDPLGSRLNPVRENGPEGQVTYLRKLRCADGTAPKFERKGNVGDGPYKFIIDDYAVQCGSADPVHVYIDMYHDGGEIRAVPGFTIVN